MSSYGIVGRSVSLGVSFVVCNNQGRPTDSLSLSSCCLEMEMLNTELPLEHFVCLHATILLAMIIMD